MHVIHIEGLSHRYGDFTAIEDVNLDVYPGEIFGFLGPNGAGKTTTIRTIMDFIRPSAGSAQVFGLDSQADAVEIRRRVGYLPSELALWENWTGEQYLRWLEHARGQSLMVEARRLAGALDYDLKHSLKGLSTGMKRKIGLIAAMAHRPELLILDEPTSGLDPLMQKVFHELVLAARAEGRTVFLSSHMLPEVERICDRVGIIRAGKLEAVESVQQLTRVSFRWLTLTVDEPLETPDGFGNIPGISEVILDGSRIRLKATGTADLDAFVKRAAHYHVRDLEIEKPTLEEIFLAFYGD